MYRFEAERQQHIERYGSFLYCPKKDNYCFFMEKEWETGCACSRTPCIVDDPDYQKLQKTIRKNVEERNRKRQKEEPASPIRRQTKSRQDMQIERIKKLEQESAEAYRRNRPRIGEEKLNQAMQMRRELRGRESKDV